MLGASICFVVLLAHVQELELHKWKAGIPFGERNPHVLAIALTSGNVEERLDAMERLAMLGPYACPAMANMIIALRDANPEIRGLAAVTVGRCRFFGKQAVPDLGKLLKDKSTKVRRAAALALQLIGRHGREARTPLQRALRDSDKYVRLRAAATLGLIGCDGGGPLDVIAEAFADNDSDFRSEAIYAMGNVGMSALPRILQSLKSNERKARSAAIGAIVVLGGRLEQSKEKVPICAAKALVVALNDSEVEVVTGALYALGRLRGYHKLALPEIVKCLKHEHNSVRMFAAMTLKQYGSRAHGAIPALRVAQKDSDELVRREAREALAAIRSP